MKKIMLSLTLFGGALSAQAQIAAGTTLLSGSLGYNRSESKTENLLSNRSSKAQIFNFTPTVGYFVADNLAVGVNLNLTSQRTTGNDYTAYYDPAEPGTPIIYPYTINSKSRTISPGIFARYYTFVAEKAAFFGQIGAGYTNIYTTGTNPAGRSQGFYGNVLPGFAFFPSNKFALELTLRGLSYSRVSRNVGRGINGDRAKDIQSNLDLGFGLTDLQLGASFYLGR